MSLCQVQKSLSRLLLLDHHHPSTCSCCHCFPLPSSSFSSSSSSSTSSSSSSSSSLSTSSPNPDCRSTLSQQQYLSHHHHHRRHRQHPHPHPHHQQQHHPESVHLSKNPISNNTPDMVDLHNQMVHSILSTGHPAETPTRSSLLLFSHTPAVESLKQRSARATLYSPTVSAASMLHYSASAKSTSTTTTTTTTTPTNSPWARAQDQSQPDPSRPQDGQNPLDDLASSLVPTQSPAQIHAQATVAGHLMTTPRTTMTTTVIATKGTTTTKTRMPPMNGPLRRKRIPYFVSCFSPLDLPWDIFVILLQYLTPGDLWTLCQVSRAMQLHTSRFMNQSQRFEYGAVRILHQEHADTMRDPAKISTVLAAASASASASAALTEKSTCLESGLVPTSMTEYREMTLRASSFSIASGVATMTQRRSQQEDVQSRSTYWKAQAECLVSTMAEDTLFEPPSTQEEVSTSEEGLSEVNRELTQTESDVYGTSSSSSSLMSSEGTSLLSPLSPLSMITASMATTIQGTTKERTMAWPLPLDRVQSMIDLLFDPNIVRLNHRRAIINCARYIAAEVEDICKRAILTYGTIEPKTHAEILSRFTVETGPFLTLITPAQMDSGRVMSTAGTEATTTTTMTMTATTTAAAAATTTTTTTQTTSSNTSADMASTVESTRSKTIAPPKELAVCSYFQIMLWHRCMSDLISLYNRIQRLHFENREIPSSTSTPLTRKMTGKGTSVHPARSTHSSSSTSSSSSARTRPRLQRGAVCCQDTALSREEWIKKRTYSPSPPTACTPVTTTTATTTTTTATTTASTAPPCTTEDYPFCCKGHSLIYTTRYASGGGIFPVSFRLGLRQWTRRLQAVSGLDLWTLAFGLQPERPLNRRTIEYCGPTEQLRFCRSSIDSSVANETLTLASKVKTTTVSFKATAEAATNSTRTRTFSFRPKEKEWFEDEDCAYTGMGYLEDSSDEDMDDDEDSDNEDEEEQQQQEESQDVFDDDPLVQRRYRIEERMRQDTMIKQELLGLCHMACGLFQEENRSQRAPPTIMSLLRKGSPWNKGTWQEGEWRHDCIDYSSSSSSSTFSSMSNDGSGQVEQGDWQKLCIATIEFLALESLRWGGNTANAELSRLRTSVGPNAWTYHE